MSDLKMQTLEKQKIENSLKIDSEKLEEILHQIKELSKNLDQNEKGRIMYLYDLISEYSKSQYTGSLNLLINEQKEVYKELITELYKIVTDLQNDPNIKNLKVKGNLDNILIEIEAEKIAYNDQIDKESSTSTKSNDFNSNTNNQENQDSKSRLEDLMISISKAASKITIYFLIIVGLYMIIYNSVYALFIPMEVMIKSVPFAGDKLSAIVGGIGSLLSTLLSFFGSVSFAGPLTKLTVKTLESLYATFKFSLDIFKGIKENVSKFIANSKVYNKSIDKLKSVKNIIKKNH
ncbi:MAG: hypothetical protein QXJ06_06205 [Candidatus Aenigmatarchaeota archaeon]